MPPLLYSTLTPWYRLIDPPADHVDEAAAFVEALAGATDGAAHTLLELGSGAGHNALHMKARFRCTLADLSPDMLALSRELNPDCEHVAGDMRTLRLDRTFDAVLIHDAICYMTTEADLLAAAETAFAHTRPGGAAIFAPDHLRETFHETSLLIEGEEGDRAVRAIEWTWDPDPGDTQSLVDYAYLLREGAAMAVHYDRHVEGVFAEAVWRRVLGRAGYDVGMMERPIGEGEYDRVFLCRRRA